MRKRFAAALTAALVASATVAVGVAPAAGDSHESFNRIATFSVYSNNASISDETVAEITAATPDGMTLIYTDSPGEQIGFVDIADAANPVADGVVPVGGEPTSVEVFGGYALVGVNTSPDFVSPSGVVAVVDIATRTVVEVIPVSGQPDSMKVSPSGDYLAVVIENERDEDLGDGELPQLPAGALDVVTLDGDPDAWTVATADLTGLSSYAPDDPEPEFVDVNADDIAVVSMQENNWVVFVDLASATVTGDFDAGTVDLTDVDILEEDEIHLTGSLSGLPREPDALTWVNGTQVATANEGDLFGGSRGFTVFETDGSIVYDSGNDFEHLAVRHGHYPEGRSENKGSEPEGIEFGSYENNDYLFVGSERGSFVAVYTVDEDGNPTYEQFLPAPLGPEGLLAIPGRDLFVASGEEDDPDFGVRASIQIYELTEGAAVYPHILSADDASGNPIPWSALSALAADPTDPDTLYAVWDSFYANSVIFTIDVSVTPAVITDAMPITGASDLLDPEGLAVASDGGWWLVSEGSASVDADDPTDYSSTPNLLVKLAADGSVEAEIGLPSEVTDCREATVADLSASRGERRDVRFGFEGVTQAADGSVYVAQQRGWTFTTDDCAGLSRPTTTTKIWTYDPASAAWDGIDYEVLPKSPEASWVGLSEITALDDGSFMLIERDNVTGDFAEKKTLQRIALRNPAAKEFTRLAAYDLLPDMLATNGWVTDKPEGAAVAADGSVYVVTDNDGVDDWSGETLLLRLGQLDDVLPTGDGTPPVHVPPNSPPGQGCAPSCGNGNGGTPPGLIGNDNGKKNGKPFQN